MAQDPRIHVQAQDLRQLGQRARGLSLLPRQPARSILNGRHASRLRGRGLNFEELRGYLPGDDVRSIDWKVTARTGAPHIRVYSEERDRPALLLVDQRMSMFFGSQVFMKSVIAAQAAAIAAHRILDQGDRVGGTVFGDDQLSDHRPERRGAALTRLLTAIAQANQILSASYRPPQTVTLDAMLQSAVRRATPGGLVLIFSDFDGLTRASEALLRRLAAQGDLILFHVADPTGLGDVPRDLRLTVSDGDLQAHLDASDGDLHARVTHTARDRLAQLYDWSRRYGFPLLPLTTAEPALDQLMRLFGHGGRG